MGRAKRRSGRDCCTASYRLISLGTAWRFRRRQKHYGGERPGALQDAGAKQSNPRKRAPMVCWFGIARLCSALLAFLWGAGGKERGGEPGFRRVGDRNPGRLARKRK